MKKCVGIKASKCRLAGEGFIGNIFFMWFL